MICPERRDSYEKVNHWQKPSQASSRENVSRCHNLQPLPDRSITHYRRESAPSLVPRFGPDACRDAFQTYHLFSLDDLPLIRV